MIYHAKQLIYFGLLASLMLLSGCATTQNIYNTSKFKFNRKSRNGVVVFKTTCDISDGDFEIQIQPRRRKHKSGYQPVYFGQIPCTTPRDFASKGKFVALSMPKGKYSIVWFNDTKQYTAGEEIITETITPQKFNPINFNVIPNKVTYTGTLILKSGFDNKFAFGIAYPNAAGLAMVRKMFPLIKPEDFVSQKMHINKDVYY